MSTPRWHRTAPRRAVKFAKDSLWEVFYCWRYQVDAYSRQIGDPAPDFEFVRTERARIEMGWNASTT
jgi:hypothetical protein